MIMTTEELFNAAVNVIRGLPKNGSYQPSHQLMLRFYGFYKQATEGPCEIPKPAFWDVVGKAKWDAWKKLGEMTKQEAMTQYVEELKKIVETMSYTEKVEKFMDVIGPFYEMIDFGDKASEPELPSHRSNGLDGEEPQEKMYNGQVLVNGNNKHSDLEDDEDDDEAAHVGDNIHLTISTTTVKKDLHPEKYFSDSDSDNDEFADPIELQADEVVNQPLMKLPMKGIPDHNDNDSGFADQVEHAMRHCAQNGSDRFLIEDQHSQIWAFFPNGAVDASEAPTPEHRLVGNGYLNGYPNGHLNPSEFADVKGLVARGGGDEDGASSNGASGGASQRRGSQPHDSRGRGIRDSLNQPEGNPGGRPAPVSGVGGGGRGGPGPNVPRQDISEQIAMALLRLQRDMDNVLARLNVLETVALAQHNTAHERLAAQYGLSTSEAKSKTRGPSWWPFKDVSFRTFLFFVTWPVVLQILLKIIASRRARSVWSRLVRGKNLPPLLGTTAYAIKYRSLSE